MQAVASKYPGYRLVRDEEVDWFDQPIALGTLTGVPGTPKVVAVGITDKLEARTVAALIVGVEGHLEQLVTLGQAENRLGWRIKEAAGVAETLRKLRIERP